MRGKLERRASFWEKDQKSSNSKKMTDLSLNVVVLGASGDLAKKMTFPALFKLFRKGCVLKLAFLVALSLRIPHHQYQLHLICNANYARSVSSECIASKCVWTPLPYLYPNKSANLTTWTLHTNLLLPIFVPPGGLQLIDDLLSFRMRYDK